MKKVKKVVFFAIILFALFLCPQTTINISAEEDVDKGFVVESSDVNEKLYAKLCDKKGKGTTKLYQNDFIDEVSLDFIDTNTLTSLQGLNLFRFDALETLDISGNKLTEVTKEDLYSMPNLKSLNLAGNKIAKIDLTELKKLSNIDLSSNNLAELNLSNIKNDVVIDISNNLFDDFNDISLPGGEINITLNFLSNNIKNIPTEYLNSNKLVLNGGVQGVKGDSIITIEQREGLTCYNTDIEDLEIKIFSVKGDSEEYLKSLNNVDSKIIDASLGVGKYSYKYYKDGVLLYDDENLDDRNSYEKKVYKGYNFIILPNKPTYKFEYKGEITESIGKVTGAVTVHLSKSSEDEVLYYKVGSSDWIQGDKVLCDKGGNYNILVKSVCLIDGEVYESKEENIFVKTSLNTVIPDILMLVIVLLITLCLFFVIIPMVSKKFFKKKM